MKIQTYSILAGSEACNARCPFCISKMTPPNGVTLKEPTINLRNFRKGASFASKCGATTAMITSKGEATLFSGQISKFMEVLQEYDFPFIELQTNGLNLEQKREEFDPFLADWYEKGMTTIAISIVHYDAEKNRQIYTPHKKEYMNLPGLINYLHNKGFSVRLACIGVSGFIDSGSELEKLVGFAKEHKVEQLTYRPVHTPEKSENTEVYNWTKENHLTTEQLEDILNYVGKNGVELLSFGHGGKVYDIDGQNLCITNSLTKPSGEEIRQLIFFPDGHLRYDWQYKGAILL
ncbi:hypothetical protein HZA97_04155 [Candidatus Woesearchaeota archaeon]|nr:hypothetical protein [Candidatus Woesearchaeota archaeon]